MNIDQLCKMTPVQLAAASIAVYPAGSVAEFICKQEHEQDGCLPSNEMIALARALQPDDVRQRREECERRMLVTMTTDGGVK